MNDLNFPGVGLMLFKIFLKWSVNSLNSFSVRWTFRRCFSHDVHFPLEYFIFVNLSEDCVRDKIHLRFGERCFGTIVSKTLNSPFQFESHRRRHQYLVVSDECQKFVDIHRKIPGSFLTKSYVR